MGNQDMEKTIEITNQNRLHDSWYAETTVRKDINII